MQTHSHRLRCFQEAAQPTFAQEGEHLIIGNHKACFCKLLMLDVYLGPIVQMSCAETQNANAWQGRLYRTESVESWWSHVAGRMSIG